MRTIGLIGGMSWESSAEYYRIINRTVRERLGPLRSADVLMYSLDFGTIERLQHESRWDEAGAALAGAARRLHGGGAECIVLCTNTMHKVAAQIEAATDLPFLHIADPTGAAARRHGARVVGLLGTRFTMEQDFYRKRLEQRYGLQVLVPEAPERAAVHRIIYQELCAGRIVEASRQYYRTVIRQLISSGAEALIFGCTEIMLLLSQSDCPVPVLDTTTLHALAAVDFAMKSEFRRNSP
jgi:aspartate racemase